MRKFLVSMLVSSALVFCYVHQAYAVRGSNETDACFLGGTGTAGWSYAECGADPMFHGGTGKGDYTSLPSSDAALGYGPASKLAFSVQPYVVVRHAVLAAWPQVQVQDVSGNLVANATNDVTLTLVDPGSATLGGTTIRTASAGIAKFNDLTINQYGDYTLSAVTSGGLTSAVSAPINVTYGQFAKVSFGTSPSSGAYAGVAFVTQPVINVLDIYNNIVEIADNTISLSVGTDPVNPPPSTLGGTTSMNAVAGLANFSGKGLSISRAGTGFTLKATGSDIVPLATSSTFDILSPIQISSPNGAEAWSMSSPYNVTWNTYGSLATGQNTVEYSSNNGTTWVPVSTDATSPYSWVTPTTPSTEMKVRVSNSADSTFTDTSDAVFKLVAGFNLFVPNGGEIWANGFAHNFSWQSIGTVANVKLEYSADGGSTYNTIIASTPNTGTYSWTPNLVSGGTNFKLRILNAIDSDSQDISASPFTIQKISLTAPTSGQRIQAGSSANITWASAGITNLKIEYSLNNGAWTEIIASTPAAPGSYSWAVPNNFTTSDNVKIRLSSTTADSDGNTVSTTSSAFTVYGQLTLSVPSASGIEWAANSPHNITWTTNKGTINNVKLEYSADNFVADINTIVASTANTGTYSWTPTVTGTLFKVRVSNVLDSQTNSMSSNYFSVTGIGITGPVSGSSWDCGSSHSITWNYTGAFTHVKIEYYNGTSWVTIASSAVNNGSYPWTVPNTPTNAARIRISDATDSDPVATSDIFNIKAVIAVTAPNGGESLNIGESKNITWTNTGNISNVKLEYYNGSSWVSIVDSTANDHSYAWTVPNVFGSSMRVRVSDADSGHPAASDQSDAAFTIKSAMAVTAPLSGNSWAVAENHDITWTNTGTVGQVRLYYATEKNNYATYSEITSGAITNSNTYNWTVSDIILGVGNDPQVNPTLGVKIKVTDAVSGHPDTSATSNAFNVIYYPVTFHVKSGMTKSYLSGLSVTCSSGWSASELTSPLGTVHRYPYGNYTTIWSRSGYEDSTVDFTADATKAVNVVLPVTQTLIQSYQVYSNFTYDYATDSYKINTWLEQMGGIVSNPTSCSVTVYDKDGNVIDVNGAESGSSLESSAPDANGVFRLNWDLTNINRNTSYFGKAIVVYAGVTYSSNVTYTITIPTVSTVQQVTSLTAPISAIQESVGTGLGAAVSNIQASVGTGLSAKVDNVQAGLATVQADTTSIKTAVGAGQETTLYSRVASIQQNTGTDLSSTITNELKKGPRSKILNRPSTVKLGNTINISYKTDSAKTPVIDVYDAANTLRINSGVMTEVGSTGVYQYALTLDPAWGAGDYTIICSESTTNSADSLILTAGSYDIAQIGTDVDTVKNNVATLLSEIGTGNISAIKTKADTINWTDVTGIVTLAGQVKDKTDTINWADVTGIKTKADTINWADVTGIKTKTDTINWSDITSLASLNLSVLAAKLDSLTTTLDTINTNVNNINSVVGTVSDAASSDTLYGKMAGIDTNISALISKWGTYQASDIINYLDSLEGYLGTPGDTCGKLTVFGKTACIAGGDSASNYANEAYNEIQQLRKEVDLNGRSETAYELLNRVNMAVIDLKASIAKIPADSSSDKIKEVAASMEETKQALKKVVEESGIKAVVKETEPKTQVSLEILQGEIKELKAMTEAIKKATESQQEPVVKTWFESGERK